MTEPMAPDTSTEAVQHWITNLRDVGFDTDADLLEALLADRDRLAAAADWVLFSYYEDASPKKVRIAMDALRELRPKS